MKGTPTLMNVTEAVEKAWANLGCPICGINLAAAMVTGLVGVFPRLLVAIDCASCHKWIVPVFVIHFGKLVHQGPETPADPVSAGDLLNVRKALANWTALGGRGDRPDRAGRFDAGAGANPE